MIGRRRLRAVAAALAVLAAVSAAWPASATDATRTFAPFAATYAAELDIPRDYRPLPPYRRGRLVVVDQVSGALDPLHAALPDDLRARSDGEIGTLVGIACREVRAFTYRNEAHTGAFRTNCTVILVDRAVRKVVGEQLFSADPPRTVAGNPARFVAPRPDARILEFLTTLEVR